jgi:hypothetical protein
MDLLVTYIIIYFHIMKFLKLKDITSIIKNLGGKLSKDQNFYKKYLKYKKNI